ncbi:vacuolar protein sorting-associated protein 37A [Dendroctonus ponderosae]|uniref:vacuolar protein sorting-associated protein 37A n=1 Tax=Dendroctonus ponderosae TaxID=77166 RepID=UPI002035DDBE|nr:vacuolar protein sorting-associated protein 37A [Dendroctonus ponderosae]KAH1004964.1 hypothetical protein HUJ05_005724 [Dendroctonus ponderosae]
MLPRYFNTDIDNRKRQINTLKIFNDNVVEITEGCEFDVSFNSGDHSLTVRVTLGGDFPKAKPLLEIRPLIEHPWVNEKGVVNAAPGLLNFTPHSDLGRVVQAVIREFQRNPPALASTDSSKPSSVPKLDAESRTSPSLSRYSLSPPIHPGSTMFPELNLLSTEELRFLDECDGRQIEFIEELPSVKDQNRMLDDLASQIEELAEENLRKESRLCELRQTVDARIEEVAKLAFDNERLFSIYQNLSEKYSPRNIQEELGKAAKAAEEESEKIAEQFLHGELDVDRFLNMFIKTKAVFQLRKTKEEKLCHQLNRLEKAGF